MRSDSCFEQIALMSCETETVRRKNWNRKGSAGVTEVHRVEPQRQWGCREVDGLRIRYRMQPTGLAGGLDRGEGPVRERWESRLILFLLE